MLCMLLSSTPFEAEPLSFAFNSHCIKWTGSSALKKVQPNDSKGLVCNPKPTPFQGTQKPSSFFSFSWSSHFPLLTAKGGSTSKGFTFFIAQICLIWVEITSYNAWVLNWWQLGRRYRSSWRLIEIDNRRITSLDNEPLNVVVIWCGNNLAPLNISSDEGCKAIGLAGSEHSQTNTLQV